MAATPFSKRKRRLSIESRSKRRDIALRPLSHLMLGGFSSMMDHRNNWGDSPWTCSLSPQEPCSCLDVNSYLLLFNSEEAVNGALLMTTANLSRDHMNHVKSLGRNS